MNFQEQFPYIQPNENTFSNERLAGLIYISPYFLCAGLFILNFLRREELSTNPLESWLMLMLAGSSLISVITVLLFYFPATRYGEDFMPSLLLLATSSLGLGYRIWSKTILAGRVYIIFIALVATFSIIASFLIAFPLQYTRYVIIFIKGIYQTLGLR